MKEQRQNQLVAAALTVSVAIYMGPVRGMDMSNGAFLACVALLALALLVLRGGGKRLEAFVEEAESSGREVYQTILKPRLDRLVNTIGGQSGSQEYSQTPTQSVALVDGTRITEDLPKETRPLQVATEFHRISFMLCQCMQSFPQESVAMFKRLGLKPPEFEAISEKDAKDAKNSKASKATVEVSD